MTAIRFLLNLQLSRMHSLPRQGMPCEEMLNDVVIYRGLLQELRRLPDQGPELGTRCLKRGGEVVKNCCLIQNSSAKKASRIKAQGLQDKIRVKRNVLPQVDSNVY